MAPRPPAWASLLSPAVHFARTALLQNAVKQRRHRGGMLRRQLRMGVHSHSVPWFERECHFRSVRTSLVMDSPQGDGPPPDRLYCASILSPPLAPVCRTHATMACLDRVDKYRQVRTASQLQVNIVCRSSLAGRRMLDVVAMQPAPGSGETSQ